MMVAAMTINIFACAALPRIDAMGHERKSGVVTRVRPSYFVA